ncbi:predicted GPI-anchored protein 58 [Zingiber officinale]|uniref:predicted GPI-anchored protein 58 n=1 Tax=Zingiber officinale TaxID=94328 RepID=UPI001C4CA81B|nr:predicted GPI-anchored protein 58 [Zingiber officinale]
MELIAAVPYLLFLLFQASQAADVVLAPESSPDFPSFPAPAPTSGADVAAPPVLRAPTTSGPAPTPWVDSGPLEPKEKSTPASAPSSETGGSIPFISSSPAVPLPVGETDTATILPFPTPGSQNRAVGMASSCEAVGVPSLMLSIIPAFASLCLALVVVG